jgi:hypothetical protein
MLEIKVNDVRGQQAPPLACRQAGAVISQQGAPNVAPELRKQQYGAGHQEPDTVHSVAIERREDTPEGRHRPTGIHLLLSGPLATGPARNGIRRLIMRPLYRTFSS